MRSPCRLAVGLLTAWFSVGLPVCAAEDEPDADETVTVRGDTVDRIGIVPSEPVDVVFGLDKSLFETPRSATSIAVETMDRLGMTDIDDLVMLSPSSFTQSFFGVSGSLDLRGTSGENYFNGIRRLDNPGNYATPIGAADRVDIVRGPASVIYGASKIGGYMNFVPKSARADTGQYLRDPTGEVSVTGGSWDKAVVAAEGEVAGYYNRDP
ncbi:MAG: TonB-dependent receptor plug domain-containing protein, partial [Gammaproteobacteria bacterium]|nr:TonB-dependent receptor plug domain-containing protein [Gammaproteobacteria bacterium]